MDYCKYVDVFYGNGMVDHYYDDGLASKWFYLKALCGNTTPHAVTPFGKMSVGSYSGGYPTGYGTHYPNCCGGVRVISDKMRIKGMSHLHHSGVGETKYYYNYAVTTPFYGDLSSMTEFYEASNEEGRPGYYKVTFHDTDCEVTVNESTAYHRYQFRKENGRVGVDFSNDGLYRGFPEPYRGYAKEPYVAIASDGMAMFSAVLSGVKLYFCVAASGKNVKTSLFADGDIKSGDAFTEVDVKKPFGVVFDFEGNVLELKVSYSTVGFEQAKANVLNSTDRFDVTAQKAYDKWNLYLSAIDIDADEKIKRKFYSNLYHSLIKPIDMTGEEVLGVKDDVVVDIMTFWDQYKTLFPLIFMLYPAMAEKITAAIYNISKTYGKIPCSFGLSDIYSMEEQAKMLGVLVLCDGYHYGVKGVNDERIDECTERELAREDFKEFIRNGTFKTYTNIIDATHACAAVANITKNQELKQKLDELSENWKNAYDSDGLMSARSWYYEGDRYTYSFRLHNHLEKRVELAGGKERFAQLLDNLFGFGKESVRQMTHLDAYDDICAADYRRFQGFNNESDMEAPFAYIYADRHDRICEIAHECVTRSFTEGKGGLPGNNDSGALSSLFVWYVLGVFPEAGNGKVLIGSPHIKRAVIKLANGNQMEIVVRNQSDTHYHVDRVTFNGHPLPSYSIPVCEWMKGGRLGFDMK